MIFTGFSQTSPATATAGLLKLTYRGGAAEEAYGLDPQSIARSWQVRGTPPECDVR